MRPSSGLLLAPEVGDVLLTARVWQHRHQFPTVLAPLVENLLGRVDQQRNRGVLPFGHVETLSRAPTSPKGGNPIRRTTDHSLPRAGDAFREPREDGCGMLHELFTFQ